VLTHAELVDRDEREARERVREAVAAALTQAGVPATPAKPAPAPRAAYTIRDAAAALSIGVTAMKELLRSGAVRAVKVGKRRRVPRSEIDRLTALDAAPGRAVPSRARRRLRSQSRPAAVDGEALRARILRG